METNSWQDSSYQNFCLEIAKCFSEKGWLGLYCLELSGRPVASLCGFKYESKYYAYETGMDPAYRSYSVGHLLFLNVVDKCIQDGNKEFDFMWGTEPYKKEWNPCLKWLFKAAIPRTGASEYFKYLLYREYWSQGLRIKYFRDKLLKTA